VRAERRWIMTGTPAPAMHHIATGAGAGTGARADAGAGPGGAAMTAAMAATTHDAMSAPHRAAAALQPLLDLLRAAPFGSSRALWVRPPTSYCPPRRSMPFDSTNGGSRCVG